MDLEGTKMHHLMVILLFRCELFTAEVYPVRASIQRATGTTEAQVHTL